MTQDEFSSFDVSSIALDNPDLLSSLRALKNRVIGCKRAKIAFIEKGVTKLLLDILASEPEPAVAVQAAQTLGSFAAHGEGAEAILKQNGVPILLQAIQSRDDERLIEASLRALKLLVRWGNASMGDLTVVQDYVMRLSELLSKLEPPVVAESAAIILSRCSKVPENQTMIMKADLIRPLVALLSLPPHSRQQAALEALCGIMNWNPTSARDILRQESVVKILLEIAKYSHPPRLRYLACQALVMLAPHMDLQPSTRHDETSGKGDEIRYENRQHNLQKDSKQLKNQRGGALLSYGDQSFQPSPTEVELATLPILVHLLSEPTVGGDAAPTLRALITGRQDLQNAAVDADCISKLVSLARESPSTPRARAAVLSAIAVVCADVESHRQQLLDESALPLIIKSLKDPSEAVRASACSCLRSLSRSTSLLRHAAKMDPLREVVKPLLEIEGNLSLVMDAAATLSNFAVEYSTVKDEVLRQNGISKFVGLSKSTNEKLRLYGVWGLSSFAYLSSVDVKLKIMKELSWKGMEKLVNDEDTEVRTKSLLLLRNMMHGKRPSSDTDGSWTSKDVLPALLRSLQDHTTNPLENQHAMYAVVNVASGAAAEKDTVMGTVGLPSAISGGLNHQDPEVREAAIWAVINLSAVDDSSSSETSEENGARAQRCVSSFRELGVEDTLKRLVLDDTSLAVRERAEVALTYFSLDTILHSPEFGFVQRLFVDAPRSASLPDADAGRRRRSQSPRDSERGMGDAPIRPSIISLDGVDFGIDMSRAMAQVMDIVRRREGPGSDPEERRVTAERVLRDAGLYRLRPLWDNFTSYTPRPPRGDRYPVRVEEAVPGTVNANQADEDSPSRDTSSAEGDSFFSDLNGVPVVDELDSLERFDGDFETRMIDVLRTRRARPRSREWDSFDASQSPRLISQVERLRRAPDVFGPMTEQRSEDWSPTRRLSALTDDLLEAMLETGLRQEGGEARTPDRQGHMSNDPGNNDRAAAQNDTNTNETDNDSG